MNYDNIYKQTRALYTGLSSHCPSRGHGEGEAGGGRGVSRAGGLWEDFFHGCELRHVRHGGHLGPVLVPGDQCHSLPSPRAALLTTHSHCRNFLSKKYFPDYICRQKY